MREVVLYIAMSLDGYIADNDNGVTWLSGDDSEPEAMGSYNSFYDTIDTVVLGRTTYNQIITELSPNEWPYKGKMTYVFTHSLENDTPNITFTDANICDFLKELKGKSGKNIWVCGGANIVNQLLSANVIDKFRIAIIPTILGKGIRLFEKFDGKIDLKLVNMLRYNGISELVYSCR